VAWGVAQLCCWATPQRLTGSWAVKPHSGPGSARAPACLSAPARQGPWGVALGQGQGPGAPLVARFCASEGSQAQPQSGIPSGDNAPELQ